MDRDKVINYFESEIKRAEQSVNDTWLECVEAKLFRDVLALLKEQEAVVPKVIRMNSFGHPVHACGKCGHLITESMNYCNECGKRIEWEGR